MHRVKNLVATLRLGSAVSQKPEGRFDNDAKCAVGPDGRQGPISTSARSSRAYGPRVTFETKRDPKTGDVLFRQRRTKA